MKVHVFVRLADSCRIETYILFDNDIEAEDIWNELVSNGWKHSSTREIR